MILILQDWMIGQAVSVMERCMITVEFLFVIYFESLKVW